MRIVTCEHASNKVPADYKHLFKDEMAVLQTHEAYDPGAVELTRVLAGQLKAPFFLGGITRLLIDMNRSIGNPALFSRFSEGLDEKQKIFLIKNYYKTYRKPIMDMIKIAAKRKQPIFHISVHSFTPVLKGKERNADVGLLYDPQRKEESAFCKRLKKNILTADKSLRVRCNYPYQGKSDGLVTSLRKNLPSSLYIGIELEINQQLLDDQKKWSSLKTTLCKILSESLENR